MVQTKGRFIDMAAVFFGESLQGFVMRAVLEASLRT